MNKLVKYRCEEEKKRFLEQPKERDRLLSNRVTQLDNSHDRKEASIIAIFKVSITFRIINKIKYNENEDQLRRSPEEEKTKETSKKRTLGRKKVFIYWKKNLKSELKC